MSEIWRIADDVKLHEEWAHPIGLGQAAAARVLRLLKAAPDDQAEAIIEGITWERKKAAIGRLPNLDQW